MEKKTIIIDYDDTCNNLVSAWLGLYNKDTNESVQRENIHKWEICEYVKNPKHLLNLLTDDRLYNNVELLPGCKETLEWSMNHFYIYIATSFVPPFVSIDKKMAHITDHLPFFPLENVVCIKNKYLLNGDAIIDDYPVNIKDFNGEKVLFCAPWNKCYNLFDKKVKDWKDIRNYLETIKIERTV